MPTTVARRTAVGRHAAMSGKEHGALPRVRDAVRVHRADGVRRAAHAVAQGMRRLADW
jgi:hypothetical protein